MQVRMTVTLSGTRDGKDWPPRGELVDLPDDEAEHMIRAGLATAPDDSDNDGDREEHATVPGSPEKATPGKKPAAKPAAQK